MWVVTIIAGCRLYEACEKNEVLDIVMWYLITGTSSVITVLSLLYGLYIVLK